LGGGGLAKWVHQNGTGEAKLPEWGRKALRIPQQEKKKKKKYLQAKIQTRIWVAPIKGKGKKKGGGNGDDQTVAGKKGGKNGLKNN